LTKPEPNFIGHSTPENGSGFGIENSALLITDKLISQKSSLFTEQCNYLIRNALRDRSKVGIAASDNGTLMKNIEAN